MAERDRSDLPRREFLRRSSACAGAAAAVGLVLPTAFAGDGSRSVVAQTGAGPVRGTVACVARTARRIADIADERLRGKVDGAHALTHPFGCSQLGDDLAHTRRLLASLVAHPNAGGVLVVGLGCENNQLAALLDLIVATASGQLTCAERNGDRELAIWKTGVTL